MTIYFDLDGTLADLYAVPDWLSKLRAYDPSPYRDAAPLIRLSQLARKLNKLQRAGYTIGIISWLSKASTPDYDNEVTAAKLEWLHKHLPSVKWDKIHIVSYGTNKWDVCGEGILFDDEQRNHDEWKGASYYPMFIMEVLSTL